MTLFRSHFKRSFLVNFKNFTTNVEFVSFFGIFTQIMINFSFHPLFIILRRISTLAKTKWTIKHNNDHDMIMDWPQTTSDGVLEHCTRTRVQLF